MTLGQRFARLATDVSVRWPGLWRLFRPVVRRQFGRMAPVWGQMRSADAFDALSAALDSLDRAPVRTLDLGTGTGQAAFVIAERFPETEVVGADLAPEMLAAAREAAPAQLADRLRFELADASKLPYDDGEFDLVTLANMIPFFDELARVTAPGGAALFSFSSGAGTPIYVPSGRLRSELSARGFAEFADFAAGNGTAMVARKREGT
jgi:ubiquinone/menaquinone biosynthesis C-methylase UbiE